MCNCEVLLMTSIIPNGVGNYPDGKPVYYDPDKANEAKLQKLKQLTDDIKTANTVPDGITVSYAPDYIKEKSKPLEYSPDKDTVELGNTGDKIIDIKKPDDNDEINNNEPKELYSLGSSVGKVKVPPQIQDAMIDVVVGLIKDYGAKAVLSLFSAVAAKAMGFGKKPENTGVETQQTQQNNLDNNSQAEEPVMDKVA